MPLQVRCRGFLLPAQDMFATARRGENRSKSYFILGIRRKKFPNSNPKAKSAPTLYFSRNFPLFPAISRFQTHPSNITPKRVFKRAKKPLSAERGTSAENIFYRTARNRRIRTRPQPESGGHSEMRPNHARKEPPARAIHCRRRMGRILRNAEIRGGQISVFRGKRACLPFTDIPKDMLNPRRQKNCRI